jgi:hypothetical protein
MVGIEVKPLSLHQKVTEDIKMKNLPFSSLNIKGQFNKNFINMWINSLIPDVPNTNDDDLVTLLFKNVFTETFL